MSRGLRNNNPGNIRSDGDRWLGEVLPSRDPDFKTFETRAWGYRAMFHLVNNYSRLHGCDTIRKIVNRWAPAEDGNYPEAYIASVVRDSGTPADSRITTTNREIMIPIVSAMSRVENGVIADPSEVAAGWELFLKHRRP